jgi:hypothetical protein
MSPPYSGLTKSQARNHLEAGGKESNRLAEISDYVGNRWEMDDSTSVPFGIQGSKAMITSILSYHLHLCLSYSLSPEISTCLYFLVFPERATCPARPILFLITLKIILDK